MAKEWFSHDMGSRNDAKMMPLLDDFKAAGYGIYWSIVELMHENGGSLALKDNTFKAIAKPIGAKTELVKKIIFKAINDYELFYQDGDFFTANRVQENLAMLSKSTKQKVEAGKASAAKRQQKANDRSTSVQQNPTHNIDNIHNRENIDKELFNSDWDFEKRNFIQDTAWMMMFTTQKQISPNDLEFLMKYFVGELELKEDYKKHREIKSHFTAWWNKVKPNVQELKKSNIVHESGSSAPIETVRERKDRLSLESIHGKSSTISG